MGDEPGSFDVAEFAEGMLELRPIAEPVEEFALAPTFMIPEVLRCSPLPAEFIEVAEPRWDTVEDAVEMSERGTAILASTCERKQGKGQVGRKEIRKSSVEGDPFLWHACL